LAKPAYVEGKFLTSNSRWAKGQYDRLPALAADLVSQPNQRDPVTNRRAPTGTGAQAGNARNSDCFPASGSDPVQTELVQELNRPGGNTHGRPWRLPTSPRAERPSIYCDELNSQRGL